MHRYLSRQALHLNLPSWLNSQFSLLATLASHTVLCVLVCQVCDEFRRFDADKTVVDGIPLEDISERSGDNERDASVFDGGSSLFSGRTGTEVVPRYENNTRL